MVLDVTFKCIVMGYQFDTCKYLLLFGQETYVQVFV